MDIGFTPDSDMSADRFHYYYIHGVFGNFFHDTMDYFTEYLYPRFEYKVVGTYSKAVEYLNKRTELGRENDLPNIPAFILNPTGEMNIADANTGAKQLFRFPNLAPGLLKRLYDPVYQDEHLLITPGFSRFKGDMELIMLFNSFYEYCDVKVFLLQIFVLWLLFLLFLQLPLRFLIVLQ